jgi:hypothetical protein
MKVYINCFNLDELPNIIDSLSDQLIKTDTYLEVFAVDGMYKIDALKISKLTSIDNDIEILKNYYENITLIVDKSYFIEELSSSINSKHISVKMQKNTYDIYQKSLIKLVIEIDVTQNFMPNNIYLEMPNYLDIHDDLVKKEIIVFLSLLI